MFCSFGQLWQWLKTARTWRSKRLVKKNLRTFHVLSSDSLRTANWSYWKNATVWCQSEFLNELIRWPSKFCFTRYSPFPLLLPLLAHSFISDATKTKACFLFLLLISTCRLQLINANRLLTPLKMLAVIYKQTQSCCCCWHVLVASPIALLQHKRARARQRTASNKHCTTLHAAISAFLSALRAAWTTKSTAVWLRRTFERVLCAEKRRVLDDYNYKTLTSRSSGAALPSLLIFLRLFCISDALGGQPLGNVSCWMCSKLFFVIAQI